MRNQEIAKIFNEIADILEIKGDLHVHSKYSDGSHDLQELVDASMARGYEYLAITDHSKGLGIARGMSIDRVLEQNKNIRALIKRLKSKRRGVRV